MNIFILHDDPAAAARALCDTHVVSQLKESAQMLSTVSVLCGGPPARRSDGTGYKPTHQRHPCVVWAAASAANWRWLAAHASEIANEYHLRGFAPGNEALHALRDVAANGVRPAHWSLTPFVQAMPEQYRAIDAVAAYRAYYVGEKRWQKRKDERRIALARWERGRSAPEWWG